MILSSSFSRVQIIPLVCDKDAALAAVAASADGGKIAAAHDNKVVIFEPAPLAKQESSHVSVSRWFL